jgi:uncharacterized protein (TIGR03437 family)
MMVMRMAIFFLPVLGLAQSFTISTFAGGGSNFPCAGLPKQAEFASPTSVAVDSAGNVYIADTQLYQVCKVTNGNIFTFAGNGNLGYTGDGGPAVNAKLGEPNGIAVDAAGNVYISDESNNVVRKVSAGGTITTFAGNGSAGYSGDNGPATSAQLNTPAGLAVDSAGNVYIADSFNNVVRKVTSSGVITTFAGNGKLTNYAGDGVAATATSLGDPKGVAVDAAGNVYITASTFFMVFKVSHGIISTVAGDGNEGYMGSGGPAVKAWLDRLGGVAVDSSGNVYIADFGNCVIWEVSNGTITVIAGNATAGYTGDGGPATSAELNEPMGVAVNGNNVYIADTFNNVIRALTGSSSTQPPSIKTGGVVSASEFGEFSAIAPGSWIEIYGTNLATTTRGWATSDFSGNNAPTSLSGTSVTIGGQSAFVDYVSPIQVNAQVPSNVAPGSQSVIVKTPSGTTASSTITVNQTEPGLLAPPQFLIGQTQYVGALFSDGVTYVMPPGIISGITSQAAQPGQTITLYGVGFGSVIPNIPAGQIVQQQNTLAASLHIYFGGTLATISYSGLAPGEVGLYQFNVVVPNVASPSNTVPVTFTLGGVSGTQTLYTAVQ